MKWIHVKMGKDRINSPAEFVEGYHEGMEFVVGEEYYVFWSPDEDSPARTLSRQKKIIRVDDAALRRSGGVPLIGYYASTLLAVQESEAELESYLATNRIKIPLHRRPKMKEVVKKQPTMKRLRALSARKNVDDGNESKRSKKGLKSEKTQLPEESTSVTDVDDPEIITNVEDAILSPTNQAATPKKPCIQLEMAGNLNDKKESEETPNETRSENSAQGGMNRSRAAKSKPKTKQAGSESSGEEEEEQWESDTSDVAHYMYKELKDKHEKCLSRIQKLEEEINALRVSVTVIQSIKRDLETKVKEMKEKKDSLIKINIDLQLQVQDKKRRHSLNSSDSQSSHKRNSSHSRSSSNSHSHRHDSHRHHSRSSYSHSPDSHSKSAGGFTTLSRDASDGAVLKSKDADTPVGETPDITHGKVGKKTLSNEHSDSWFLDDNDNDLLSMKSANCRDSMDHDVTDPATEAPDEHPLEDHVQERQTEAPHSSALTTPVKLSRQVYSQSLALTPAQRAEVFSSAKVGEVHDQKFSKKIMDLLWTREELDVRSAKGIGAPNKPGAAGPEVTPDKKKYLLGLLEERVKKEARKPSDPLTEEEYKRRVNIKRLEGFLSPKISTVKRDLANEKKQKSSSN